VKEVTTFQHSTSRTPCEVLFRSFAKEGRMSRMSNELDDLLTDMMSDNFGTGGDWMTYDEDMVNNFVKAEEAFNDGAFILAHDPILGNMGMEKKKMNVDIVFTTKPEPVDTMMGGSNKIPAETMKKQLGLVACHPLQPRMATTPLLLNTELKRSRPAASDTDQKDEDKREKKRQAVRKCREKKRREMKDLEQRAVVFDKEVRELQDQLKRARIEGIVEDTNKNKMALVEIMEAIRSCNGPKVAESCHKILGRACTAFSPSAGVELRGSEAICKHFQDLALSFRISNWTYSFKVDPKNSKIIRCDWSTTVSHVAHAFGVHTHPGASSHLIPLVGSCKFTFNRGNVTEISVSYDHSKLLLELLGIPSI
jgi:hypothetical protein